MEMLFLEKDDTYPSLYRVIETNQKHALDTFLGLYADHAALFVEIIWETNPSGYESICVIWKSSPLGGFKCQELLRFGPVRKKELLNDYYV